jgi:ATP-binding cassette subfamily B protein/ATP-binding cassette subfamily C protein/ATP-binding cassette subfamily B multidrug efflux pump
MRRCARPIAVQDVRFHYPGQVARRAGRRDPDLQPGRTLGLVGPTGAGKSTLLRLLLRHHAPDSGGIHWNGVALPDYTLAPCAPPSPGCRRSPSCSPPRCREHRAGAARGDAREIEKRARLAAVHDDIRRLPQGYDTPVGERGVTLSGGPAPARGDRARLLADAPLLLLDDALSAVDADTEARILAHLRDARVGRTVVIVGHRLSAVADADHIVVLRDGHVGRTGRPRAAAGRRRLVRAPVALPATRSEHRCKQLRPPTPAAPASCCCAPGAPERRHVLQGIAWLVVAAGSRCSARWPASS